MISLVFKDLIDLKVKALEDEIRTAIRSGASDAHVPAVIKQVQKVPYTRSGKKVELRAPCEGPHPHRNP